VAEAVAEQGHVGGGKFVDQALAGVDVSRRDDVSTLRRRIDDLNRVGGVADSRIGATVKGKNLIAVLVVSIQLNKTFDNVLKLFFSLSLPKGTDKLKRLYLAKLSSQLNVCG